MKKILYVINADWYFNLHWRDRAFFFKSAGYSVHVAMPINNIKLSEELTELGLIIHHWELARSSMSICQEVSSLISLNRIVSRVQPELIHSVTIKPNLYSIFLAKYKKIPIVSTFAGLGTLGVSNRLKFIVARKIVFNLISIFSQRQSNVALFENNDDLSLFRHERVLPDNKMIRVYGAGVDTDFYSYAPPGSSERLNVLFASRLLKNKGLSLLFNAIKRLDGEGHAISLTIAGIFDFDSPFSYTEQDIEFFAKQKFVEWLGKRDDIHELIKAADIVCLPTTYGEGVPRILIEACAVGRPIITTNLGGCKDICLHKNTGLLISPFSEDHIYDAILNLLNNRRLIHEYGLNGRKLVENIFSNEQLVRQHAEIYDGLLSK